MDLYTIRNLLSGWAVEPTKGKRPSTRRVWGSVLHLAWLGLPIVVFILLATHSTAAPYHFFATGMYDRGINASTVTDPPSAHSAVLAAAFGFQAAGSSIITVRTYDGPSGVILSEDSFDVNVKEEGATQHEHKGRIFAGGIGRDSEGKSKFMLRVYDAETGRFLWEGQLNLLKVGEAGITQASVALIPIHPAMIRTSSVGQEHLRTLFSLRAVNPVTGRLVWQDQFAPGSEKRVKGDGVLFDRPAEQSVHEPTGHIFDLIVRTYDLTTGTLLWEDSFEQLDRLEEPAIEPRSNAYPQAIPSWSPGEAASGESHRMALQ